MPSKEKLIKFKRYRVLIKNRTFNDYEPNELKEYKNFTEEEPPFF